MLPLHDENPSRTRPWVTYALIALNVVVFLHEVSLSAPALAALTGSLGMVPREVVAEATRLTHRGPMGAGELATLFTSMFLHGGWMHLGGNMLYLYIFGDNVEDELGHRRFLLFYLACGLLGSLAHVAADPTSAVPTIGASGAISGVLGAYLMMHPTARITTLVVLGFLIRTIRVPAFVFLGLWFVMQSFSGWASLGAHHASAGGVAWFAHIGGFVAGGVIGLFCALAGRGTSSPRLSRQDGWYSQRR